MFRKAREVMKATLDEETGGMSTSAVLARKGDLEGAAAALKKHLEDDPEDADAWYRLGEILCRAGRTEEGYAAFREGRKHFRTGPRSPLRPPAPWPPTEPRRCSRRPRTLL